MYSLISHLNSRQQTRFANIARTLNTWAALIPGGLIESQVRGQPYVGFNALVLNQTERDELAQLTYIFGQVWLKALTAIVSDSTSDLSLLGWPTALDFPLRSEPPNRWLTALGRFDFALDPDNHWQLLEFNSDTPSGAQEASLIEARSLPLLTRFCRNYQLARLNPSIGTAMAQALLDEANFAPVPFEIESVSAESPTRQPVIGFLARGRHLTDLAQVLYYTQALRDLNPTLNCVVGDPLNLALVNNRPLLLGQPLDALYRLFPIEDFWRDPIFAAYTQANLNGSFKCLNNLRGFLAQSKAILAWIWRERENASLFDATERAVIAAHLPPTYFIKDFESEPGQGYIIKEFFGREGVGVWDGANLDATQWQSFQQNGNYIVQSKVNITPLPHFWLNARNQLQSGLVTPCVGSFLIGGEWGGCYSRVGKPITDALAQFVPTLLDTPH